MRRYELFKKLDNYLETLSTLERKEKGIAFFKELIQELPKVKQDLCIRRFNRNYWEI